MTAPAATLCKVIIALSVLAGACAAGLYGYASHRFENTPQIAQDTIYEVTAGHGIFQVALDLESKNLLSDARWFQFAYYLKGMKAAIKAGEYELSAGLSAYEMLSLLQKGANYHRSLTVQEGLTSYQIVKLLEQEPALSGEVTAIPPEGSLLPETYRFTKGQDRQKLLETMQTALNDTLDQAWENRASDLPFDTKEEALILASIIEKETAQAEERQRVSGVFINRLRRGMKLQTDPTVIYAITMGEHKDDGKGPLGRRLLRKDLGYDSPYNTYMYKGLPPAPIANVGKAAIEAALNPESHDYLYFVADGSGGHGFSKTLSEHNARAARWRKIRNKK